MLADAKFEAYAAEFAAWMFPRPITSFADYQNQIYEREERIGVITDPNWRHVLNRNIASYLKRGRNRILETEWTGNELQQLCEAIQRHGFTVKQSVPSDEDPLLERYADIVISRTPQEIRKKLKEIRELNSETHRKHQEKELRRCCDGKPSIKKPSSTDTCNSWREAMLRTLRVNESNIGISKVATKALRKIIKECEKNGTTPRGIDALLKPDYPSIYGNLANIAGMKSPRNVNITRLDAAVLLSIIEEIEREVDRNSRSQQHIYSKIFADIERHHYSSFDMLNALGDQEKKRESAVLNVFGLSCEQLGRSPFGGKIEKRSRIRSSLKCPSYI
ncbi:hypothetical protein QR680_004757 [Steinernema hermaphroditum]|uniref:Uncharacterized protein n=1 Tax=Steinernema hermaphroditum TaxID=289476 RepID=A0AA39LU73_9BILA|nr:hypothetical protein QR680_004757 [Steinernema hermaphroditum]